MIYLACPESCQYLHDARAQAADREAKLRADDEQFRLVAHDINENVVPVLLLIENAIVKAHRGIDGAEVRDIKNSEILESIENAIKNFQTEETGLIYEHRTASPRAEEVSRRIRAAIDELNERFPPEVRPRRADALRMLNVERAAVELHIRRGEDDTSYLRHISLYFPWPEEKTRPLII